MGRVLNGSILSKTKNYECKYDWPNDCFVQYGDRGIVFTNGSLEKDLEKPEELLGQIVKPTKPHYRTAFFEAFPIDPKTFIRGEGKTVEEAEDSAWKQLQKYLTCGNHEFEKRNYKNGCGFCKHCDLFQSDIFEPETKCVICQTPSYYSFDNKNNCYCESHYDKNPNKIIFEED